MGIRAFLAALTVAIGIAAAAGSALAQDFRGMSLEDSRLFSTQPAESDQLQFVIDLQGRASLPLGSLDVMGINGQYYEFFSGGFGVSGEFAVLLPVGTRWHIGPYVSIGWDGYGAGKRSDASENEIRMSDDLNVGTYLVGPRAVLQMGRHGQLDLHMAIGAATYSKVDGSFSALGVRQDGTIFKSSTAFAFDVGLRFNILMGPAFIDLGVDVRSQGGPAGGDFATDRGAMVCLGLEFGVGVRF
jgi:hypothetical protein